MIEKPNRTMDVIAVMVVTITATIDAFVLYHGTGSGQDAVMVGTIIGAWNTGGVGVVLNYFFGSSAGSARKSELLATSTPGPAPDDTVRTTSTTVSTPPGAPVPTAVVMPPGGNRVA